MRADDASSVAVHAAIPLAARLAVALPAILSSVLLSSANLPSAILSSAILSSAILSSANAQPPTQSPNPTPRPATLPTPTPTPAKIPLQAILPTNPALVGTESSTGQGEVEGQEKPEVPAVFAGGVPTGVSELKAMQAHLRKLSDRLLNATVGVRVGQAYGSGVIVEKTGLVLTAAHVAQRASTDCEVILLDGSRVPARALGLNRNLDAALIRITKPGTYQTVEMAPKDTIRAGQWCVATGHPGGVEKGRKPVLRLGRILETSDTVLVSDCTLVGGDSGGPLFDASGRVIGIHSRIGGMLTANLHVPIDGFHRSWERLAASEEWGHLPGQAPFIGVRGAAEDSVARITEVFPETPAERAGMKPGDIVLRIGGEAVTNFASLTELIGRANPGENLTIVVKRGDERLELRIVIGKR